MQKFFSHGFHRLARINLKNQRQFVKSVAKNLIEPLRYRLRQEVFFYLSFHIVKFFKIEPPKNSRTIEVSGTRLKSKGRNHSRNASRRFASMNSGVPCCTCRSSGSTNGLSAASSYTSAELNITSAFS